MDVPQSSDSGDRDADPLLPARLGQIVAAGTALEPVLRAIAEVVVDVVADSRAASFTMLAGVSAFTSAGTGPLALHLDRVQYDVGTGPCLDAARGRLTVLADLSEASDYPVLGRAAGETRISHSLSVGLATRPATGGLNVYGTAAFTDAAVETAQTCVRYARIAVLAADSTGRVHAAGADGLQRGLQARVRVQKAMGIVMYRNPACTAAGAGGELARLARAAQQTVGELAAHLVEDVQRC